MNFVLKVYFLREFTTSITISKFMTHFRNYDGTIQELLVTTTLIFN